MVLNERQNEQNRQKWISREKRERLDLSASVEETLEDAVVDEVAWGEELDEQSGLSQLSQRKGVFPPRLSLQSRPVPALYSDNSVESYLSSYAVVPSEQERKAATVTQNTNILKRFAQRLTSSFAALGGGQHEIVESLAQSPQEEVVQHTMLPEHFSADESVQRFSVPARESMPEERVSPQRPVLSIEDEFQNKQSKQRLAGRATRIHLETPPVVGAAKPQQPGSSRAEKSSGDLVDESSLPAIHRPALYMDANVADLVDESWSVSARRSERVSSTIPPEIAQKPMGVNLANPRQPVVDVLNEKADNGAGLSGSGVFEPGRGEAIVVNRHVTEASVVMVTLTANPGPVVVQYVTLRPRIGFTVHLTAPTTMRASFNYIVLLGELF